MRIKGGSTIVLPVLFAAWPLICLAVGEDVWTPSRCRGPDLSETAKPDDDPAAGDPAAGDPAAGVPAAGDPASLSSDPGTTLRCELLGELAQLGLRENSPLGRAVQSEISQPNGLEIEFEGSSKLSVAVVEILLEDLPETARLVNRFQDTSYRVAYTNRIHTRFYATNQDDMSALYVLIGQQRSPDGNVYAFLQDGNARLLFWHFWGKAILRLELRPNPEHGSDWRLRYWVFTTSPVLYGILRSPLLHYLVNRVLQGIFLDIEDAVTALPEHWPQIGDTAPAHLRQLNDLLRDGQ